MENILNTLNVLIKTIFSSESLCGIFVKKVTFDLKQEIFSILLEIFEILDIKQDLKQWQWWWSRLLIVNDDDADLGEDVGKDDCDDDDNIFDEGCGGKCCTEARRDPAQWPSNWGDLNHHHLH